MIRSWLCARSTIRATLVMHEFQKYLAARTIVTSSLIKQQDKQVQEKPAQTVDSPSEKFDFSSLNRAYKPDKLERRLLVWTGKYKSIDEVPSMIKYVLIILLC